MLVNSYACLFCRGVHLCFIPVLCSLLVFEMYNTVKNVALLLYASFMFMLEHTQPQSPTLDTGSCPKESSEERHNNFI